MDMIKIENLKIYAFHGVFPEENSMGQYFYVNAYLYTDTSLAAAEDDLQLSTHYGIVCSFINDYFQKNTYKLIETAAERTAREILLHFPLIKKVMLEVRKPHAPIPLPFSSVSVAIERQWHTVYIAFGSNLGDRQQYIRQAITWIEENSFCRVRKVSKIIQTAPYGVTDQEDFLNGVLELETLLNPQELLTFLHEIENASQRKRIRHWGPRTLDLDIIFFDDEIIQSENLIVPHPDMENRDFVLEPLAEIAPWKKHPVTQQTVKDLLKQLISTKRT